MGIYIIYVKLFRKINFNIYLVKVKIYPECWVMELIFNVWLCECHRSTFFQLSLTALDPRGEHLIRHVDWLIETSRSWIPRFNWVWVLLVQVSDSFDENRLFFFETTVFFNNTLRVLYISFISLNSLYFN